MVKIHITESLQPTEQMHFTDKTYYHKKWTFPITGLKFCVLRYVRRPARWFTAVLSWHWICLALTSKTILMSIKLSAFLPFI